ncbi:2-oxoglutarate malate carrier protein, partial [Blastocystis sp. subtype 4]|uniref:2-oxoglutarate malate carrier protein n=1 Tax=Blastocystis sp. subtype 4 TaxID=944170 RepID=UPI0007113E65
MYVWFLRRSPDSYSVEWILRGAFTMSSNHPVAMALKPYVAGGSAAVIATMCVHPVDLLKTRVVPAGQPRMGSIKMARMIVSEGGITKLYAGLSAAIMRQAVYGTARLGLHDQISKKLRDRN